MAEVPPVSFNQARERAIESLSTYFAQDELSLEELERRIERAYQAKTIADLDELTADLRARAPAAASVAAEPSMAPSMVVERDRMVAIMSESKRHGVWSVPQELDVLSLMSDATIDLTQARLPAGIIDLHIRAIWTSLKIILPPGLPIANRMHTLMSSVTNEVDEAPFVPGAPVIRLSGWAAMAEVKVLVRRREE